MTSSPSHGAIDPRYRVVGGAFLIQAVIIGSMFAYGVFFKALESELGWSRTLLASCSSVSFIVMGVLAIVAGRMTDRFGPRIVLAISGIAFGLGFIFMYWMSQPWHLFLLYGLFIGIGLAAHDVVTLSTIARWFERRRGVMTGIAKIGTACGQIVIPIVASLLIANFGWRMACLVIGIAAAVILTLAAQLMRRPPENNSAGNPGGELDGLDAAQAKRTREFWMLCAVQFCFLPSLVTVPVHLVVHATDLGMETTRAAALLSIIGGLSILGRITVGALVDRLGSRVSIMLCFAVLLVALLMLRYTADPQLLFVIVALYGFAHGGFFTVASPAVAEYFGMKAHSSIFGIVVFCGTLSATFGPIVAGRIFDISGSYNLAFMILAALAAAGFVVGLLLRPPQRQHS